MVEARFVCSEVAHKEHDIHGIKLRVANEVENREFWLSSPTGAIEIYTVSPVAAAAFEPGHQYRVTFEDITAVKEENRPPEPAPVAPAPPPIEPPHGDQ